MPEPVIVLIEDEPQIRRFLRATLTGQGYRLFESGTGTDGIVEVATRQPDVVIIDLGLPDMDGLEVIRRVREWSAVPIIVLSARGQERDKVAALDAGADDYIGEAIRRGRAPRPAARGPAPRRGGRAGGGGGAVHDRRPQGRSSPPPGLRGGDRGAVDPDRVPVARHARQARGEGADAPAAAAGGLGARPHGASSLPARLHGPPAAQARGRAGAPALSAHGAGVGYRLAAE